jgi:hypothetical protein
MGRRRPRPEPDADLAAALEEEETIERLATYRLRLADPPLPGFTENLTLAEIRKLCEANRDHPEAEALLETFEAADERRAQAEREMTNGGNSAPRRPDLDIVQAKAPIDARRPTSRTGGTSDG